MLCYLFLFIFTCEALPHRGYSTQSSDLHIQEFAVGICRENSPWEFAARICRGYLPREFAVGICRKNLPCLFAAGIFRGYLLREFAAEICRGYLPWLFAVCICKEILFCICDQILFIWEQTFLICEQYFLFVRFSLSIMFLSVIAEAVMGHRMLS